jgi:hypothetical protein
MATQYTTLLKLALPTQGELSGAWGDVINNNITSMVEEAVAGLKTINTWSSNSAVLSTADGTTAESRAAILNLTDTTSDLTGAATLVCPTLSKVYIVKNGTGQTVTIKTSAGSGIAVSNGNTSIVYCDGTNVVEAVTGITGNLDVGGNLTVGGNATVTGTTTFNGGTLTLGADAGDNVVFGADVNSSIIPNTDDTFDLGSSGQEWRNLYLDGTANIDALVADTADINGGTIDGVTLGTNSAITQAVIDSIDINGKVITMTGDTNDTAIFTAGTNGTLTIVTTDNAGTSANITITADGTAELAGTTVTLNSSGDITLDADGGTITFADAGSSLGTITSNGFTGNVVGNVTGNTSGTAATVTGAAQSNITSLGTLTTLTIDDILIDGKIITLTGSSGDTATITAGTNGTLDIATTDAGGAAGNIQITADGTAEVAGTTVTLDSAGGITLDADGGTITFADGGSSLGTITSSGYSGTAATVVVTDSTANTNFPIVFHNESNGLLDDTGALRYNPSTGELLVPKLTVAGTTTTVDTVTMNAANAIIFEGATADVHETTLTIVDPTADRTINLPNQSGTVPLLAAASNTAITSTPEELNLLDGATVVVGEINALDLGATAVGTAIASKAVILDSSKDYTGIRNLTISGELDAATLDISGDIDVDGITNLDVVDIDETLNVAGETTLQTHLNMGDSDIIKLGDGADLQIFHDGLNSYIKDVGTGNLILGCQDFSLTNPAVGENMITAAVDGAVTLYHDNGAKLATTSTGIDVTGTVTSTGTSVFASLDISGDIDVAGTTNLDVVDIDGAVDMASTLQVDGAITSSDGMIITTADNTAQLILKSTDGDSSSGPRMELTRDSGSPANADNIGLIVWKADDAGGNSHEVIQMLGVIEDVTDGSEDGSLDIRTIVAGNTRSRIGINITETVINNDSVDLDFRVESDTITHALFVDGANGNVGIGQASPASKIHASGAYPQVQVDDTASRNFALGVTSSSFRIRDVTGSADRLTIDANGNILASTGTITANRADADQNILGEATTAGHASRLQLKAANYSGGAYNAIQSFQGDATPAWEISGPKANATNIMLLSTGGTERMRIDATGCVTMPLQPAFQALPTGDNNNVTGNGTTFSAVNIAFTEIFDNNGDFNHDDGADRGKFTAPVAGRYLLGISCFFSGLTSASTSGVVAIATSNRTYNRNFNPYNVANVGVNGNYNFCILADMDAGDTANFSLYVNGNGSDVVDLAGSQSSFYGNLVC